MRWANYHLTQGDEAFRELWSQRGQTPTLVVIGGGFDPRTVRALAAVAEEATAAVDVVRLELSADTADEKAAAIAATTREQVEEIAAGTASLAHHPYPEATGRRAAGVGMSRSFHEAGYLSGHDEVLIDISGLPRSIYFPLIVGMLQLAERGEWTGDLHVAVCDNP